MLVSEYGDRTNLWEVLLRILMLSNALNNPDAGAARVFLLLQDEWRRRGYDVDLLHLDDFGTPRNPFFNLLVKRTILPTWMQVSLRRRNLHDYDIIIASSGHGWSIFKSLQRESRRPLLINHLHGLTIYDDIAAKNEAHLGFGRTSLLFNMVTSPIQNWWDFAGIRHSDSTVVLNVRDLNYVEQKANKHQKVSHIAAALHPEIITLASKPSKAAVDPSRIVWFGSWDLRKCISQIPRTFDKVRQKRPDATLTIGGTGKKASELLPLFAEKDRSNINVLPRISKEEQAELFKTSPVFLFPSLSEGFGLALLEAMAFGIVVVTTNTGFGADYMTDRVHGRVVYPSSNHLANAILETLENSNARETMGLEGQALAQSFTIGRMADAYEAVLFDHR